MLTDLEAPDAAGAAISGVTPTAAGRGSSGGTARWTGFVAFVVLGWACILLPSLIRDVKAEFGQSDAGIVAAYLSYAVCYAAGSFVGGVLAELAGRRVVLPTGAALMAVGLAGCAAAPGWLAFVAAYVTLAVGAGAIDAGVNGLFMDLFAGRSGGAFSRLHLCYSIGALGAPVSIGLLVGLGVPWRAVFGLTAVACLLPFVLLRTQPMPDGRRQRGAQEGRLSSLEPGQGMRLPLPLAALAVAIGCCVAAQTGISNWLVAYLGDVPIETATLGLSLFWLGIAAGRLVSTFTADRMGPTRFAALCGLGAGLLTVAAVFAPAVPLALAAFGVAGIAFGPIFPMIMSIAGEIYPGRASMVGGVLASAGVCGSILYPPLMGWISDAAGLGAGMVGAGVFAIVSAAGIATTGLLRTRAA